jgi:hypothetical protein
MRVEQRSVGLGLDVPQQRREREPGVADDRDVDAGAPADVLAAQVDLHDDLALGIPVDVREVRPDHEQQVGGLKRLARGRVADHAGLPELKRVVALEALLRLQRQHDRRAEPVGEREQLLARVAGALTGEDRHRARGLDPRDRVVEALGVGRERRIAQRDLRRGRTARDAHRRDIARQRQHGDRLL